MAINNYTSLKRAISNWMARDDIEVDADDFITLAEARLNRELGAVETEATLNGTVDSNSISISAQSVDEPLALFLAESGLDQVELVQKAPGTFPVEATSGRPQFWARDSETIKFNRPLDSAYPFRFRFDQKFALTEASPTNWLLTNHPDLYLTACLVWGGAFTMDTDREGREIQKLTGLVREVKNHIAQSKRGILTVDPALASIGSGRYDTSDYSDF